MRELQRTGAHVAHRHAAIHQLLADRNVTRVRPAIVMSEADKSAGQRVAFADVQSLLRAAACAPCAVAAPRVKYLIVFRITDDADFALTLYDLRNRHAVIACSA